MFIPRSWILLTALAFGTTQKTCYITDDIQGECILFRLCPRAQELLMINDIKSLKNLTCGFDKLDAKVCCVTNKTDGAITFKNTTQETATARQEQLTKPSHLLPPDPNISSTPSPLSVTTPHTQETKVLAEMEPAPAGTPHRVPVFVIATTETIPIIDNQNLGNEFEDVGPLDQREIVPQLPTASSNVAPTNWDPLPSLQYPVNILPSRNECGLMDTLDKIYGGQVAALDELPWLVRIKYLIDSKEVYACHGSLITDHFVITAAHCVVPQLKIIEVRLGEWDAETDIDCVQGECSDPPVDVKVEKVYINPSYDRETLVGDIALLLLETPVNFTDFIRPVCLPNTEYIARQDYDLENEYLTGGWGKTEYEMRSIVKRKIKLNAVPMSTCRVALKRIRDKLAVSSICAGGRKGEDSCAGDSGSSLVKQARENYHTNWFLFGITSYGPKHCGTEGLPGVYTRTTFYMNWIMGILTSYSK